MKSTQYTFIFFAFALLLCAPYKPVEALIDLEDTPPCVQVVLDAVGQTLSYFAIPTVKELATCMNFVPRKTENLDAVDLVLLAYEFVIRASGDFRCLSKSLHSLTKSLKPYARKWNKLGCNRIFLNVGPLSNSDLN
ncbi:uncharacterized protein LOC133840813 isoform X2 [Drosophila sulfurigaster albostrigata]|uniref:uncharacterized protein LOC133840813 isoform X2 n=1 Tax=Drosophila sulfurigaster albostrigata TaxID=89887 RepID=UPI002D21945E|nr:uncharacterized protein LOC133840813 isoform X2 [Drosophila sulfurigaster albostrigata]